ncbi:MAG: thiol reductant ABC exporter subunit CydD [Ignavibacterium sp.]
MLFNKQLFNLTKNNSSKFFLLILFGLVASLFTIAQAFILSRTINNVFLLHQTLQQVFYLIIIYLSFSVAKAISIWLQNYFSSKVVFTIKKNLREQLTNKIKELGPLKLKSERTGEIVNTLLNGVDKLEDYFSKFLPQMFLAAFIPILILFFVLPRDFLSAVIFIVTAPIIPVFMFLIGSLSEKLNRKQWVTLSRMSAYFFDVLQGLVTLKLFNRTKETIKRIDNITNIFRIKTLKVLRIAFLSALVLEVASTISVAIIAVAIGLRLLNGDFNFADALFILIIAPDFYLPLRQLGVSYHAGMEGVSSFERISELMKNESSETMKSNQIKGVFEYDLPIIFENVSFTYEERNIKALDSISVVIEPKKVTALVGQTGSGKTTLMSMLLRFISPSQGIIKLGDQNLLEIYEDEWRKNIAWIPQSPHIFNKTILENIKLSKDEATIQEVIEAASKSKIHKLISSLPHQYDTLVSEAGENFSGGEIQRIALARAYLRNAKIILVDEPTANLDPIIEEEIMNDMFDLFKGKTVLIIAHRLNTIIKADKIIVMKNGKIDAIGNHSELLHKSMYYKNLFEQIGMTE